MGLFDKIFGKAREPNIITKEVVDPAKSAVASPLSSFLASRVGKGLDPYTGPLTPGVDPDAESRYKEFLSLDSPSFFKKYVGDPATQRYREDILPVLQEGYAGNLRGSGRFSSEEESLNKFSSSLAGLEGDLSLQLPQAQFAAAETFFRMRDVGITRAIEKYYRELPENNPVLGQALQFLSEGTSSGKTILSGLDPGKKSGFGDFLKILATVGTTALVACWVASEIYGGWAKPKTVAARYYVLNEAPVWFRLFYIKNGEAIARFIRNKPVVKWILKPLFDYFAWRGK